MKNVWPLVSMALVLSVTACVRTTPQTAQTSLSRACVVAVAADARGDKDVPKLQLALRERRDPARAAEHLGYRFIALARLTNDAGYYKVAEHAAACLETMQPGEPAALLLRGHVLHQMHRFAEAETIARRLIATREFVLDYGLLGDVLMEQGRVSEAADAYQKMIDIKPFYQSYVRAAHLRWLTGDLRGAIEMMNVAVKAASPRDRESVAWAYSRLAFYELQRGDLVSAQRMTDASLEYVPGYASALLTQGRIHLARNRHAQAVETLERAVRSSSLPEYQWALADALRIANQIADAVALEERLVRDGPSTDPRTLALYLSTRREDGARAVDLARRELEIRRDVFTLDALAWALAANGQVAEASTVMAKALDQGTQDGRLFVHAAAIAAADGREADARRWARKAWQLRSTLLPSELGVLRRGIVRPPQA